MMQGKNELNILIMISLLSKKINTINFIYHLLKVTVYKHDLICFIYNIHFMVNS